MRIVQILVIGTFCCTVVSSAGAFDTAGKFGMGLRFWGTPIIAFSSMKIGVTNRLGLEPSVGYYMWKNEYGDYESSNSMLLLSLTGDMKTIRAGRSNFMVKLGGAFAKTWNSSSSTTSLAVLGGVGMEHFVNDNFSVNVGALSGFWTSSPDDYDSRFSLMSLGNQLVDFSLVWYLE